MISYIGFDPYFADEDSQISQSKVYTHLLDFEGGGSDTATVNDVAFTSVTIGNVDAIPGFHYAVETGGRYDFPSNNAWNPTGVEIDQAMYDLFNDFIYQEFSGGEEDGLPVLTTVQGDALFMGWEGSVEFDLLHQGRHHLLVEGWGDYVRAELRKTSNALPRIPPLRFGTRIRYNGGTVRADLGLTTVTDQNRVAPLEEGTEGYSMVDMSVGYRLFTGEIDPGDGVLLQVLGQGFLTLVQADPDNIQAVILEAFVQRLDLRHRLPAGAAPTGPEVDQNDFAAVTLPLERRAHRRHACQFQRLADQVRDVRSRLLGQPLALAGQVL